MSDSPTSPEAIPRPAPGLLIPPEQLDKTWHHLLLRAAAAFARALFTLLFRLKVTGLENVPDKGPVLVTVNHVSAMDVPSLGAVMIPKGWEPGVNMFTIAKQELFQKPILPRLMAILGMFPVYRNTIDMNAMRTMLAIFKRGAMLGIAPEGARSPTGRLQLFQPGVAKLAIQKRLPILPVGLVGMEKVLPIGARFPRFVPISIHFGKVFELADYYGRELTPEDLEKAAWEMRQKVAELLPEWMRELPPSDSEFRFGSVRSAHEMEAI